MKELSIEEKAKAYDEAIKKVNDYYEGKIKLYSDVDKTLDYLFPALKESEDERIRKQIIYAIKELHVCDETKRKCVAWLERQDKHANFRNAIQIGDKVTRNEDGVLVNLSQLKRVAKPAEEYNITGIGSKHAEGKLGEMIKRKSEMEKQGGQKPTFVNNFRTWLYIVADVLTEFNGIGQYLDNSDCREMAERLREKYCFDDTSSDWQKVYQKGLNVGEIYGRNKAKKEQEQKLVEWSEEDERIYKSITYSFAHNFPLTIQQQEFVKSLKERYTWKPSDEQINALEYYIYSTSPTATITKGTIYGNLMVELLEQLKKLKGE